MRPLIAAVLLLAACGGESTEQVESGLTSRDWTVELSGVCTGTMATSQTETVDLNNRPYATYYTGSWSCGTMRGTMNGVVDIRTKTLDLIMVPGPVVFHVVGSLSDAGISGTANLQTGNAAFTAK